MASSPLFSTSAFVFLAALFSFLCGSHQQPALNALEQESVYRVLESLNSAIPWRSYFPGDLCVSAPHGVVCDYFSEDLTPHITEFSFGYVSGYTPNPPCAPDSTLNPLLFTSFSYLRRLFFYRCFTGSPVTVPALTPGSGSSLEEIVFIENPALVGPLARVLTPRLASLRRAVFIGNGVYGEIPDTVGDLVYLQELTLSRNQLSGGVPPRLAELKRLKVLDLSHNSIAGNAPESLANLTELVKMDLSSNGLSGKIPESFKNLQRLEFLDLSYNRFGNFGIPLFLGEMSGLREVYLSGNSLEGHIPEIWRNLGGIFRIGFSEMGLMGKIPASMAVHLRNLCYLGLDSNKLEGTVPQEFGSLQSLHELNLENNNLSGRVPFSAAATIGKKLKLGGNSQLCVDDHGQALSSAKHAWGHIRLCNKPDTPNYALFTTANGSASAASSSSSSRVWLPSRASMCIGLFFSFAF